MNSKVVVFLTLSVAAVSLLPCMDATRFRRTDHVAYQEQETGNPPLRLRQLKQDGCSEPSCCLPKAEIDFTALKDACANGDGICSECLEKLTAEMVGPAGNEEIQSTFSKFYDANMNVWNKDHLQICAMPYSEDFITNAVFKTMPDAMKLLSCTDDDYKAAIEPAMCKKGLGSFFTDKIDCSAYTSDDAAGDAEAEETGDGAEGDGGDDSGDGGDDSGDGGGDDSGDGGGDDSGDGGGDDSGDGGGDGGGDGDDVAKGGEAGGE